MSSGRARRRVKEPRARQSLVARYGCCEPLESRRLLSTVPDPTLLPDLIAVANSAEILAAAEPTAISVAASPSPSQFGDSILLEAFVQPSAGATGTVSFFDSSTFLGIAPVDTFGTAKLTIAALAIGSHSITATYSGNDALLGSTSEVRTLSVGRASVQFIKDINPGGSSGLQPSTYASRASINGTLFFLANDGEHGVEVWKSDGTAAGTAMLKETSLTGTSPSNLTNAGGRLFFVADGALWTSDGTTAGTVLVKSMPTYGGASNLTDVNGRLFFTADDATHGRELWKSDGTAEGTVPVKDIYPGTGWSNPASLVNVNGTLFFVASDGVNSTELWKSNGTAEGTVLVKDISPVSSFPASLVNVNGTLFFTAGTAASGNELWKSDGTEAGTVLVKDIRAGINGSYPSNLASVGGMLFFAATDTHGTELWKSDGTAAGTVLVKDIRVSGSANPSNLTNCNGTLFFTANDGSPGSQLWESDGTAAGTVPVMGTASGSNFSSPSDLMSIDGLLYFATGGGKLWRSDGTSQGTVPVGNLLSTDGPLAPTLLTNVGGTLFFAAKDSVHGIELWKILMPVAANDSYNTLQGQMLTIAAPGVLANDSDPGSGTLTASLVSPPIHGMLNFSADGSFTYKPVGKYIGPDSFTYKVISSDGLFTAMGSVSLTIEPWTDVTLVATPVRASAGQPVVLRATIGAAASFGVATGTVTFRDGPTVLATVPVDASGQAALSTSALALGQHSITAEYIGNASPEGSTSLVTRLSVGRSDLELVRDINTVPTPSAVQNLVNVNGTLFFTGLDGASGWELWRSDGTEAGTVLVSDIAPGVESGLDPATAYLTNINGKLFFVANDGVSGAELWTSDGTAAGTFLVKDICPGSSSSNPSNLVNVSGTLFFTAYDPVNGPELWKSDGTIGRTVLVKDIYAGNYGSNPTRLVNADGMLFLMVNGTRELWRSNGTEAGTVLVKSISIDTINPPPLTSVNGTIFFPGYDSKGGAGLWKSDGTAAGTVVLKSFGAGSSFSPGNLINANGTLFFTVTDGVNGMELWKSDGTAAGTVLVKDINPGQSGSSPGNLTNINGTLYFTANDGMHGRELWRSDGTADGTILVQDIALGSGGSFPGSLLNVGGTLFFAANDGTTGAELWMSDGTPAGTVLVKDIVPGSKSPSPLNLADVGGMLFFTANGGTELWKSNGTADGTILTKRPDSSSQSSSPVGRTNVGGTLFFAANDGITGTELWKTDGTTNGAILVKDIAPGSASGIAPNSLKMIDLNGTFLFVANDGTNGEELWRSDGTSAGTVMVKDINPGIGGSYPSYLANVNGTLFFVANGTALWKTDGTADGTVLVKGISTGSGDLTNVNGTLFFTTSDSLNGTELWKSDGTETGTVLVRDIYPGKTSSSPVCLTDVNGTLFFAADDPYGFGELWKSDGTEAGTVLVKNFSPGGSAFPRSLTVVDGTLFFTADTSAGTELWKSDGTEAGTVLVKDIYPGYFKSSNPADLINVHGTLFFSAYDPLNGTELWKSDGTEAGTVLVKDINPGSGDGLGPMYARKQDIDGVLFFMANDPIHGRELWKSDGTEAGTVLVKDLAPGSTGSAPTGLTDVNGTLFFTAFHPTYGTELWRLLLPIAQPDSYDAMADQTLTVLPGVLANDSGPGGSPLTASLVTPPAHGGLTLNPDGSFTYTPATGYVGSDTFTYRALDSEGGSATGTVSLTVWPPASFQGSAAADTFVLGLDPTGTFFQVWQNVPVSGDPTGMWPVNLLGTVSFAGLAGDDQLTIDCSNGNPIPANGVSFDGGEGSDVLCIIGTSASDTLSADSANLRLNATLITSNDVEKRLLDGPMDLPIRLADLSLSGFAQLALPTGGKVLQLGGLSITESASLDLADNDLIISATPATKQAVLATISNAINKSARGSDAKWAGNGLTSSAAKANRQTGLAVMLNEKNGKPIYTTFGGQPVTDDDILVKYTWNGDVTLDGKVDIDDYFLVDSGFITQQGGYRNGDLNFDGKVDIDDYFLIDSAFIAQTGLLATEEAPVQADDGVILKAAVNPRPKQPSSVLAELFSARPLLGI